MLELKKGLCDALFYANIIRGEELFRSGWCGKKGRGKIAFAPDLHFHPFLCVTSFLFTFSGWSRRQQEASSVLRTGVGAREGRM